MANTPVRAFLAHIGYNMWADPAEKDGIAGMPQHLNDVQAQDTLRFDRSLWHEVTAGLAAAGANMLVLDIGEGVRFDCAPGIAAKDAWSKQECAEELARLREMGFEVIPKLNFSACHDEWMGEYGRMVSTPAYYRFTADIIAEACELFGRPRFFHIGMDEEQYHDQRFYNLVIIRQGDLWWHDLRHFLTCVEKAGSRPWMWADSIWYHPDEFLSRMPRDVLMSNWYYGDFAPDAEGKLPVAVTAYDLLDRNGFDQIPTGSNWSNTVNFSATLRYARGHISDEHLLGILHAPWHPMERSCERQQKEAVAQMAGLAHAGF